MFFALDAGAILLTYPAISAEVVEIVLAEYQPFGIVPAWSAAMLPPWIVGYLILVIPVTIVLKPLLRVR